jgi:hypothetical protein
MSLEKCTGSRTCVGGFMDCQPCPFTLDDYYNGDIDAFDEAIATVVDSSLEFGMTPAEFISKLAWM